MLRFRTTTEVSLPRAWLRQHQRSHLFTESVPAHRTGACDGLFDFGRSQAEVAQSRGAYAKLAGYRQAALRATDRCRDALMELAQTQVARELQGEVLLRGLAIFRRAYKAGAYSAPS